MTHGWQMTLKYSPVRRKTQGTNSHKLVSHRTHRHIRKDLISELIASACRYNRLIHDLKNQMVRPYWLLWLGLGSVMNL